MIGFTKRLASAALVAAVTLTGLAPAYAIDMPRAPTGITAPVVDVQYRDERWMRRHGGWNGERHGWNGDRPGWRSGYRDGYWNGHRGYRDRRDGYRYHNGYWFPLAAFGAGAIIGGAIASEPRYVERPVYAGSYSPSHVNWCENRYRSYRAYDNSYQPTNGGRRACISPYS